FSLIRRRSKSEENLTTLMHRNVFRSSQRSLLSALHRSSAARPSVRRRHSSCVEMNSRDTMRIATIYGWVTDDIDFADPKNHISPPEKPLPPVENDPHVFNLLERVNSCVINYITPSQPIGDGAVISAATIEKLIEKLTSDIGINFLLDFFLTYRQFISPVKLCKWLILRFRWAVMEETEVRRLVRIRTFVVLRYWMTHFWTQDFKPSRTLRFILSTFLSQLRTHPAIVDSDRDSRIIRNLRTVFKKQRKLHSSEQIQDSLPRKSCVDIHEKDTITEELDAHSTITLRSPQKPFILQHRSEIIMQQFCIIEKELLERVTWVEIVEMRWKKTRASLAQRSGDGSSPTSEVLDCNIDAVIEWFNLTYIWVISEIVSVHSLEVRVQVIEKFIRIALKCYHHRNYSTLLQILLGLQSPYVSRLNKTWHRVDQYERQIFDRLKDLPNPERNWKRVRNCMTSAVEAVAETQAVEAILSDNGPEQPMFLSQQGSIPFLGKLDTRSMP
ncbi:ras guanine nucleotide exchange factor domain-containing protein, partial [Umbelopsis sp. PMI_123]